MVLMWCFWHNFSEEQKNKFCKTYPEIQKQYISSCCMFGKCWKIHKVLIIYILRLTESPAHGSRQSARWAGFCSQSQNVHNNALYAQTGAAKPPVWVIYCFYLLAHWLSIPPAANVIGRATQTNHLSRCAQIIFITGINLTPLFFINW